LGSADLLPWKTIGPLTPGYFADFVVLDQNLFEIDPLEIKNVRPVMTVVKGQIVYVLDV
jgi:predicted amidohydrolase YtcJ